LRNVESSLEKKNQKGVGEALTFLTCFPMLNVGLCDVTDTIIKREKEEFEVQFFFCCFWYFSVVSQDAILLRNEPIRKDIQW